MPICVDVVVPRPLPGYYTYLVDDVLAPSVVEGSRVVVPFGQRRYCTAVVRRLRTDLPAGMSLKAVAAVVGDAPAVLPTQLRLWDWVADYYLCTPGDVYKAAMPAGLRVESETRVRRNPDFEGRLTPSEQAVYDLLSEGRQTTTADLGHSLRRQNILPTVNALLTKGAVVVDEQLRAGHRPRTVACLKPGPELLGDAQPIKDAQPATDTTQPIVAAQPVDPAQPTEAHLHALLDRLQRAAPKQHALLLAFLERSYQPGQGFRPEGVARADLLTAANASPSTLKALTDKGILAPFERSVGEATRQALDLAALHPLSPHQEQAYAQIQEGFRQKDVCLLQGVTAGGKTEIYLHLMAQVVAEGRQVLYLLPEIALTKQITDRLRRVFGSRLGVYHSKYTDAERSALWQRQLSDDTAYDVVVGVRSSVFLPFRRLGLVIVDEEHETTYKQQDPAPRYHARNTALVLASFHHAKTLLGSATPSIESRYNADTGKYAFATLTERYADVRLPRIVPVDVRELRRKKLMKSPFSPQLLQLLHQALESGEQAILFQNRRGYAPMIECHTCGWVPRCINCDVSLSYHRLLGTLSCHYCGYSTPPPTQCPACQETDLRHRGFGTERLEDEIRAALPQARVARMDLDTTRSRSAHERILSDFEAGQTDILVGTQMVSKGLDFDRVSVVGILDADLMLNIPDFRSYERAYQLMAQVAGRAGRRGKQGIVVLQTRDVHHPIVAQVEANDYEGMLRSQLAERRLFRYPPYYRLVYAYLKHRDERTVDAAATLLADVLRQTLGSRVLGPDKPAVARVQTFFVRKIVVKIELVASTARARQILRQAQATVARTAQGKGVLIYFDVDPM